ncbi:MAG: CBS domain-containing protein [Pirellulaceae bacterium]|jgi:CBS domain-containing protein|nr:CBS domain-containing protein [Pirellulaceae bacterium]
MMLCPYCGHENIQGVDECEHCKCSLADVELLVPATPVERDLLRDRAGSLTSRPPLTVTPLTPVRRVLQLMNENSVGCVGIVKEGRLVGVFSERDALLKLGTDAASLGEYPVSEFMTANPKTLGADAKIAFAVRHMDQGGFRHLPIVSETNELVGVLSVRDILRYVAGRMGAEPLAAAEA